MNILIVEDESIIREGIKNNIPWQSLGFSRVETAENGIEALEIVELFNVDLIITDIRMPFMDGLQLVESIKQKYPEACIIIISGHDEFSYAQQALQLNAFDYILKPINLSKLLKVITRAKKHIENAKLKKTEITVMKTKLIHSIPALKERFILDTISSKLSREDIINKSSEYDLNPFCQYTTALISIDNICSDQTPDTSDLQKQLEIFFYHIINSKNNVFVSTISIQENLLIMSGEEHEKIQKELYNTLTEIMEYCKSIKLSITIATGTIISGISNLRQSYMEALHTSNYKFIKGGNCILLHSDIQKEYPPLDNKVYNIADFVTALYSYNQISILDEFKSIRSNILKQNHYSEIVLKTICINIFFQCKAILDENSAEIEAVIENPIKTFQNMIEEPSAGKMFEKLETIILKTLDYINLLSLGQYTKDVEKAKNYINENCSDVDLNLKSIANYINMSPCYFSSIFKKEAGIAFSSYLKNKRIDKSKKLLTTTHLKVYEISYEVGYNNPTYFSTIFKNVTGISPYEFRNKSFLEKTQTEDKI